MAVAILDTGETSQAC